MNRSLGGLALLVAACSLLAACVAADPAPPLAAAQVADTRCPPGSGWTGVYCARTLVVNEVTCPAGSKWDGARCLGDMVVDCPVGTRFVDGVGCVAELAFEAQPPPAAPPSPTPAPTATGVAPTPTTGVADPWRQTPKPTCGCAASDLMCRMKCSATCKDGAARPCQGSPAPGPVQNTGREFDRNAAVATLSAASGAARSCTGATGTGRVRVVFAASGKVSSAVVEGAPFGGTPQGECIAAIFRKAAVPAFDGSPVAVTKSVSIP